MRAGVMMGVGRVDDGGGGERDGEAWLVWTGMEITTQLENGVVAGQGKLEGVRHEVGALTVKRGGSRHGRGGGGRGASLRKAVN